MEHLSLASGLALLLLIAALSVLAQRMKVSSPMLMLVAGIALAFVPGVPAWTLHPDLIFLGLLPPLLYTSGVNMSWRGFRSNLRPILMLAIGCVIFTASAVAVVGHYLLGLPWVIGFLLGSIVSPPDAVAPIAFMRDLSLPRRLTTILEGESLINDATALVIFGFALAALATGSFSIASASVKFIVVVCGETGFGILVGWAMLHLRDRASDARAEVLLALATPFIAFWPPRALGGSGVVACVAAGLWVSWNGRRLIRPATRLQGYFIWDLVTWVIEALVFLLTGLQARAVVGTTGGYFLARRPGREPARDGNRHRRALYLGLFGDLRLASVAQEIPGRSTPRLAVALCRQLRGSTRRCQPCSRVITSPDDWRIRLSAAGSRAIRHLCRHRLHTTRPGHDPRAPGTRAGHRPNRVWSRPSATSVRSGPCAWKASRRCSMR